MARIRSVHPGLWTDERFMEASPLARLLFIGIWTECDDYGAFEWSPIKLKARILPADNCDIRELMAELEQLGSLIKYEIGGRQYGAVRNFTRFQRPKKPNPIHPQTPEVRNFTSGEGGEVPNLPPDEDGVSSEPVGNQFGTGGENLPQMEDGGWRMEDGGGEDSESNPDNPDAGAASKRARRAKSGYAFEGAVIRLVETDMARWRKAYSAIPDIAAELTSLDAWLTGQPPDKQKNWFHIVSGALNRKHQSLVATKADDDGPIIIKGLC